MLPAKLRIVHWNHHIPIRLVQAVPFLTVYLFI